MPVTAAVISLFNPDHTVLVNAAALLKQVDAVVAVDDGSSPDAELILARLAELGCVVECLPSNMGIAAALNAGIAVALSAPSKPEFILTMDQDSLLHEGYSAMLLEAAAAASTAGVRVGMVGPGRIRGLPVRKGALIRGVQLGGEPIQSGLLIPTAVLEELGSFDSRLFIDGVDSDFYLRCRSHGYQTVLAPDASLNHSLGRQVTATLAGRELRFRGKKLTVRAAADWRYYYIFRNRLLLGRKFGRRYPWWLLKGILADYRHLVIVTLLVPGRRQRLANALSGIASGMAGYAGKRPTPEGS
jgi:rhamnosyltransferase